MCFFSLSLFYSTVLSLLPLPQTPSPWTPRKLRMGGEGRGVVQLHICCRLSGVLSPPVACVLLQLAWPQVGSDKQRLRPDMCSVSQFWRLMFDICCCLSGFLSPAVACVSVAVVWPQAGSGKRRPRRDVCSVSQFGRGMFEVRCCLSGVLSPTVACVSVAVGVVTSRVG